MTTHDLTRTRPPLLRRARLTFFLVTAIMPLLVTAIGTVVLLTWLPSLPDRVATHWSPNGADAFGPPSVYLWIVVGIGFVLPVAIAAATLVVVGTHWGAAARFLGAVAAGLSAFATSLSLGSLFIQRDLTESDVVPGIEGVIAVSFGAMLLFGATAWAVQPRVRPVPGRTLESRHAVRVAEGERVVWLATTSMPRGALAALLVLLGGLIALAVFMLGTGVQGGWVVAVVVVVLTVALAATSAFRVRVTPEGLTARALLGWPRIVIPLTEIESVRAVDISPFGEFGGWGWRISVDGRTGIVMRRGPAIEVSRHDRRPFIVTIDGAEEGAALLQDYVDRARTHGATLHEQGEVTS